jgi:hypothetical protein
MKRVPAFLAMTGAVFAFVWTGVGETSNPELYATELPIQIVNECGSDHGCRGNDDYLTRWVGKTAHGHLFLVRRPGCGAECGAWMIEKTARGAEIRLSIDGDFRLDGVHGAYPDVQVQRAVSGSRYTVVRYSWVGERYRKTDSRDVYRIGGIECSGADDCYRAALKAHRANRSAEALKIFETVHGLSWI